MKDMEIKTENRYEYRKTQEKRKQMIAPDLFEFAYVPDWYGHLAELERLALPESWRFRKPSRETKNTETPILERYIHTIFRKQVIDFNSESDPRKADSIFHLENECVCFHTGLYTPQYKGIYGYFERNNFSDSLRDWYFRGFCDELSPKLRYIEPLPQKPVYHMAQSGINFNPEWPIRVTVLMTAIVFSSIFTLISMLNNNKAVTAVICILTAFLFLIIGAQLHKMLSEPETNMALVMTDNGQEYQELPNPKFLDGGGRKTVQFFYDFLPGGQVVP